MRTTKLAMLVRCLTMTRLVIVSVLESATKEGFPALKGGGVGFPIFILKRIVNQLAGTRFVRCLTVTGMAMRTSLEECQ